MVNMEEKEFNELQESYIKDSLYCSFADTLEWLGMNLGGVPSIKIWSRARECLENITSSRRPDIVVSSMFTRLSKEFGADDIPAIIMICVMYMICSDESHGEKLTVAAKKIAASVYGHPLLQFVMDHQRAGENDEEMSGNPVPVTGYFTSNDSTDGVLCESSSGSSLTLNDIPVDLRSCIANTEKIAEYATIIKYRLLPFINSEEGGQQLWKVVMDISKERGYITNKCSVIKFAQLLSSICPEVGDPRKLKQNADKYSRVKAEKQNDYEAINSRFGDGNFGH